MVKVLREARRGPRSGPTGIPTGPHTPLSAVVLGAGEESSTGCTKNVAGCREWGKFRFGGQGDDRNLRLRRLGGEGWNREHQPSRPRGNTCGVQRQRKPGWQGSRDRGWGVGVERGQVGRPEQGRGLSGKACRSQ